MIISFTYGFKHNSILYGWKSKKLYRLPQMIGKRFYPIKTLDLKKWNNDSIGYLVGSNRKSLDQLKSMTIFINQNINEIKDNDCPF